jgi:hypothetical protein
MDIVDVADAKMLHRPDRADHIDSLEEHLNIAARLSRAMWELAASPDLSTEDDRSREALQELAGMVADHASAARYAFYKENADSGKAEART